MQLQQSCDLCQQIRKWLIGLQEFSTALKSRVVFVQYNAMVYSRRDEIR